MFQKTWDSPIKSKELSHFVNETELDKLLNKGSITGSPERLFTVSLKQCRYPKFTVYFLNLVLTNLLDASLCLHEVIF